MNQIERFLNALTEVAKKEIPETVIHRTKLALLDYIGVTLAGRREQGEKTAKLMDAFSENGGLVFPVGIPKAMSMNTAVFLNGLHAHTLDFDDGTNAGIIHLGSPVFSVLLPLAQRYPISGERFLKAAVLGYEASFTMARTIQPAHKLRGYHATGTCGVLGIAVAASYALGLDPEQTKNAVSTAAVSATGTLKVLEDGSDLKPYNVAKTALLGLTAVQMAMAGFTGADDAFSGTAGYLSQMFGTDEVDFVPMLLDGTYAIEKAYIKPYAACRYCHPSIDIAADLRSEKLATAAEVERVEIRTYDLAVKKHDHTDIRGAASAKMSIPYNFAVTYLTGKTGMDAFTDEVLNSGEVDALTKKVSVTEDADMTAAFPEKTIAEVRLCMKDGSSLNGRSILPKGEPENPLTEAEAIAKYAGLAAYGGKNREEIEKISDAVLNLETKLPELLAALKL